MDTPQILHAAAALVERQFIGTFVTLDAAGEPHARLMGAAMIVSDNAPRLYSICGRGTRKVDHLRHDPRVCWLFHSPDHGQVVELRGRAHLRATADLPESIWEALVDVARPYAEQSVRDDPHFAFDAIEMRIEQVELLGRDFGLDTPAIASL